MTPHDSTMDERQRQEDDLLWSASRVDRRADHHLPEYVVSPAVGEHAVTVVVPRLERELEQARAVIHELRSRIALTHAGGATTEGVW